MPLPPSRRLAALGAALVVALTGCGADTAEQADGASLLVYSGRSEELVAPLIDRFAEESGIDVEVRYAGSGELAAQLVTEGDASPADVFLSQDAGALGAVAQAGLFAPMAAETLAAVPSSYSAGDGTWVGVSGRARVLVYNAEQVPTPPDTVDALLDPQWRGRIGYAPGNASWQAFVTGLRVLRGDEGAREWLTAFRAQQPRAYEGNVPLRDAVNSGELPMALSNHYYLYELIDADGPDAVVARNQYFAAGDPGGLVNVAGVGVLASAPHAADAQRFAAYLVGRGAQEYFATETDEYPLVAGVAPGAQMPPLTDLAPPAVDLSQLDDIEATQELLVETGLLTN